MVTIISQKDSYTHFNANGAIIKAWTIVGGTIGMSFDDFSFQERNGKKNGYINGGLNQNPEISDFPNGEKTIIDFVTRNLPKKELRDKRYNTVLSLVGGKLISKRFHDLDNRCYFRCNLDFSFSHYIPPVTISSTIIGGRCTDMVNKFADTQWITLSALFNSLCDNNVMYEDLTEDEFENLCKILLGKAGELTNEQLKTFLDITY